MSTLATTPEYQAKLAEILDDVPPAATYADPYPGKRGDDRVWEACLACGGTGAYSVPTRIVRDEYRAALGTSIPVPWCFTCDGAKGTMKKVASIRGRLHRHAKQANDIRASYLAGAEKIAEQAIRDLHAERDRIAAEKAARDNAETLLAELPEAGTKLEDIDTTAAFFTTFDSVGFNGRPEIRAVLKLQDADGRIYVWITGSRKAFDLGRKGAPVRIERATVKRTSIYRADAQVELARPKLTELELVAA